MEMEAIKHWQEKHHRVVIHHPDMSILVSDEGTVAIVTGKSEEPESSNDRLF
jgi:hypothetical protein